VAASYLPEGKIEQIQPMKNEKLLLVQWEDGKQGLFPFAWLRDSATSDKKTFHMTPALKARKLPLEQLDLDIKPLKTELAADGDQIHLQWPDGAETSFKSDWLRFRNPSDRQTRRNRRSTYLRDIQTWGSTEIHQILSSGFDFRELQQDPKKFYDCLRLFTRYGVVLINAAPRRGTLKELISMFNYAHETHFGHTWNVEIKPTPTNLGYTASRQGLHTDSPAFQQSPEVTVLHVVKQTEGKGGDSELADSFRVAEQLKVEQPDVYRLLTTVPVEFIDEGSDGRYAWDLNAQHKILELDSEGKMSRCYFNGGQRGWYFDLEPEKIHEMYRAIKTFNSYLYQDRNLYRRKLENGAMLLMANDRILHGRTGFEGTSQDSRLIEGCFFSWDVIRSRIRVIQDQLALPENQPSF
jgi:gamma-butyrobetaine dioxygenase